MRLGLPHVSTVLVVVVLTKAGGKIATIFLVHRSKPSHYFFGRTGRSTLIYNIAYIVLQGVSQSLA